MSGMTGCGVGRGEVGKPFPEDRFTEMQTGGMVFRYRFADSMAMRGNFGWILRFFLPVGPSIN